MKLTMLISAAFCVVLLSCGRKPGAGTTALYLLPDPTSDSLLLPTPAQVRGMLGLDADSFRGAVFEVSPVGEAGYEPRQRAELPACGPILLANPFERARALRSFDSAVAEALAAVRRGAHATSHSEVYRHVARSLNRLSGEEASAKVAVVASDLADFNYSVDLYGRDLAALYADPAGLERRLDSLEPLGDLGGVTLILAYRAKDNGDSRRYEAISAVYRRMAERRRAKVIISAGYVVR